MLKRFGVLVFFYIVVLSIIAVVVFSQFGCEKTDAVDGLSAYDGFFDDIDSVSDGGIQFHDDLKTDSYLQSDTNTLVGVDCAGAGNMSHGSGLQGWYNTAIGFQTLYNLTVGWNNLGFAYKSLYNCTAGANNIGLGSETLKSLTNGSANLAVGFQALGNGNPSNSVAIGTQAGMLCNGSGSVFIGSQAGAFETTGGKLYISNTFDTTPLIYGNFSTDHLTVNGTLTVTKSLTVTESLTVAESLNVSDVLYIDTATQELPGSTSGTVIATMPFQGSSFKKCMFQVNGLVGSVNYEYPESFSYQPLTIPYVTDGLEMIPSTTSCTITCVVGACTDMLSIEGF